MKKYSCIIIEDEPLALERTKIFANKIPFLSLDATFDNAIEGLAYLNSNEVDLLFLDINMDFRTAGIHACNEIKEQLPNTKVYFLSAYEKDSFNADLVGARHDGYIDKLNFDDVIDDFLR